MKLIYYELKKVLSKRLFISLCVFSFIVNLCAFYFTHNDYQAEMYREYHAEYEEMLRKYSGMKPDEALSEITKDEEAIQILYVMQDAAGGVNNDGYEFKLAQLEEYRKTNPEAYKKAEEMLVSYSDNETARYFRIVTKMQLEYLSEYPGFIGEMGERAQAQTEFSVFSDKDSFSYKNIMKTAEDYDGLQNTKITLGSDYPLVSALTYNIGDYFVIAIVFLACIYLFRFERDKGLSDLVRSSKNGRLKTAISKMCALLLLTVIITIIAEFSTIAESTILFGKWELSRPIQSIKDFQNCILPVRCDDFCLLYLIGKAAAMAALAEVISLTFVAVPSAVTSYAVSGTVLALEFALYHAVSQDAFFNHLKYINIFYILDTSRFFGKYLNLNIFRVPLHANAVTLIFALLLFIVCITLSVVIFTLKGQETAKDPISEAIERFFRAHAKINGSTAVLTGELYKYLISSKMAAVMLAVVIFAVSSSMGSVTYRTSDESVAAYRQYVSQIEGKTPTQAKSYIENEKKAIDSADSNTVVQQNDLLPAEIALVAQNRANARKQGFDILYEQYIRLTKLEANGVSARFVDETIYADLVSNPFREWRSLLWCVLLVILTIPFVFTYEYRKNMIDLLQATKNGRRKLFLAKLTVAALSLVVTFAAVYVPFMVRFYRSFHAVSLKVPLVCVSDYSECGLNISIGAAYLLETVAYFFIAVMAASAVVFISIYAKNHTLTVVFSAAALVIPMIVIYPFERLRIGELFKDGTLFKLLVVTCVTLVSSAALIALSMRKFTGRKEVR